MLEMSRLATILVMILGGEMRQTRVHGLLAPKSLTLFLESSLNVTRASLVLRKIGVLKCYGIDIPRVWNNAGCY